MFQIVLPITLTIAAAAALLNVWIATRAGQARRQAKVSIGDGGHPLLAARMRAHANFAEYTPFVLILMALIELGRGSSMWLWAVGIIYILARIAHAFGMDSAKPGALRGIGIAATLLVLIGLAAFAIYLAYQAPGLLDRGLQLQPAARASA